MTDSFRQQDMDAMQQFDHEALLPREHTPFSCTELAGSIVARFGLMATNHSEHAALKHCGSVLTYRELDQRSNALAQLLLQLQGPDTGPVALLYRQGLDCHIAQLATLKAGRCYSHIDLELAPDRQALILSNLGARLLLCDSTCLEQAESLAGSVPQLQVFDTAAGPWIPVTEPPALPIAATDDACIVYTSGSTAQPQGVVLTHRNVLAIARNCGKDFRLGIDDRASQLCPLWTAASCLEIFSALLNGCTLYPCAIKEQGIAAFLQLLDEERLTTLTAAPPLFRILFGTVEPGRRFDSVRLIRLGGDRTLRSDLTLFRRHFGAHCLLRLAYGASEFMQITQCFLGHDYEANTDIIPVGRPMGDCEVLLLDDEGRPVATGEYGEIAARSAYLSKGYWHNPQLTQERFVPDSSDPAQRLYLTRDIGYIDEAGNLHHVGRKDSRVKLCGKLVLLSDIELALLKVPGVSDAVVIPVADKVCGSALTAFVVPAADDLDAGAVRTTVARMLPAELVPRTVTVLAALPLGLSNKISRLSLSQLAASDRLHRNADGEPSREVSS